MSSGSSAEASAFQPKHFFVIMTMLAATAAVLVARGTTLANLVLISLTVMAAGWVGLAIHHTLSPLAAAEGTETQAVGGRTRLALEREKMLVLRSLKELEFDRAMGKIADADFEEMMARLRGRAIGLMKRLDEQSPAWQAEIEREVERRLATRGVDAPPTRRQAPATAPAGATCSACGTANDADARFCKSCGEKIATAAR